jgi:transcriptional regulator of heat shock response
MIKVIYGKNKLSLVFNQSIKIMIASLVLVILNSSLVTSNSWAQRDLQEEALRAFQNFTSMTEGQRMNAATQMNSDEKAMVMMGAAQSTNEVNETIAGMTPSELEKATIVLLRFGNFTSQQNGTEAQGLAKLLSVNDNQFLRFENFNVTNGPDLHVYFTNGQDINSGMDLGMLKGNMGAQNYFLGGIADKYDTIVIASKPFGTIFATSSLRS